MGRRFFFTEGDFVCPRNRTYLHVRTRRNFFPRTVTESVERGKLSPRFSARTFDYLLKNVVIFSRARALPSTRRSFLRLCIGMPRKYISRSSGALFISAYLNRMRHVAEIQPSTRNKGLGLFLFLFSVLEACVFENYFGKWDSEDAYSKLGY